MNNGQGGFTEQAVSISGITTGKLKTADLNQDGYEDVIITGVSSEPDYIAKVYLGSESGEFLEIQTPFMANSFGDILVYDLENDGDLDVLLTGFSLNYEPETHLYLNDGAANFTELEDHGLENIYFSTTSAGDIDQDGDLDLLISGYNSNYVPFSGLYTFNGSSYSLVDNLSLPQVYWGLASLVDVNQDGELDIFIAGADNNSVAQASLFLQQNGEFISAESGIGPTYITTASWIDYDQDGDLDLIYCGLDGNQEASSIIYENTQTNLSVIDNQPNISLIIYPNPAQNYFTIEGDINIKNIKLFNVLGQEVKVFQPAAPYNISELLPGSYLIKIETPTQTIFKKIIKK